MGEPLDEAAPRQQSRQAAEAVAVHDAHVRVPRLALRPTRHCVIDAPDGEHPDVQQYETLQDQGAGETITAALVERVANRDVLDAVTSSESTRWVQADG